MVFEYLDMDMSQLIESLRSKGKLLPLDNLFVYTRGLVNGLLSCHDRCIVHRDLKPQNLLVSPKGLKIADFGLARLLPSDGKACTCRVVTLWYRAPELLLGQTKYRTDVDMWSVGCVFAEMATSKPLFDSTCEIGTLFKIFQLTGTPTEETCPGVTRLQYYKSSFPWFKEGSFSSVFGDRLSEIGEEAAMFLRGLLQLNPAKRLTARQAKRKVDWFGRQCTLRCPSFSIR